MVLMMGYFISRRPLVKSGECMYSYFFVKMMPVVVTVIEILGMVTNWPNATFFVKRKLQTMPIFNKNLHELRNISNKTINFLFGTFLSSCLMRFRRYNLKM